MDIVHAFDLRLLFAFNHYAGINILIDQLIVFTGVYLWYLIPLGLIFYWFVGSDRLRSRKLVLMTFVGLVLGRLVFAEILKLAIFVPRPYLVYYGMHQLIFKETESAFPSGHTSAVFAMATVIYFYNRAWGIGLMSAGVIIGAARVVGGVHYPSDIIGGIIIGVLTGLLVHYMIGPRAESSTARISRISDRLLPFTKR